MDWIIHPLPAFRGTLRVPGDKSLSHRLALMSALARGRSRLLGFLDSEDCLHALDAMAAMGAGVRRHGTTVEVEGTGGTLQTPGGDLDMGRVGEGVARISGPIMPGDREALVGHRHLVQAHVHGDETLDHGRGDNASTHIPAGC